MGFADARPGSADFRVIRPKRIKADEKELADTYCNG